MRRPSSDRHITRAERTPASTTAVHRRGHLPRAAVARQRDDLELFDAALTWRIASSSPARCPAAGAPRADRSQPYPALTISCLVARPAAQRERRRCPRDAGRHFGQRRAHGISPNSRGDVGRLLERRRGPDDRGGEGCRASSPATPSDICRSVAVRDQLAEATCALRAARARASRRGTIISAEIASRSGSSAAAPEAESERPAPNPARLIRHSSGNSTPSTTSSLVVCNRRSSRQASSGRQSGDSPACRESPRLVRAGRDHVGRDARRWSTARAVQDPAVGLRACARTDARSEPVSDQPADNTSAARDARHDLRRGEPVHMDRARSGGRSARPRGAPVASNSITTRRELAASAQTAVARRGSARRSSRARRACMNVDRPSSSARRRATAGRRGPSNRALPGEGFRRRRRERRGRWRAWRDGRARVWRKPPRGSGHPRGRRRAVVGGPPCHRAHRHEGLAGRSAGSASARRRDAEARSHARTVSVAGRTGRSQRSSSPGEDRLDAGDR